MGALRFDKNNGNQLEKELSIAKNDWLDCFYKFYIKSKYKWNKFIPFEPALLW
jgi:hypothetical protein